MQKWAARRLQRLRHINRMEDLGLPQKALNTYEEGKKKGKADPERMVDNIKENLKGRELAIAEEIKLASDLDMFSD